MEETPLSQEELESEYENSKKEVNLQPIERKNLDLIQTWRNSPTVMPFCRQYRPLTMSDMERWYDNLHKDQDYNLTNDFFIIEYGYEYVGVCGLTRICWRNRKAEVSFYVGDNAVDTEAVIDGAMPLLMAYAIKTLGLNKIYFPCYSSNPNIKFYEKHLRYEYTARKEYYWEGQWLDRIVLVAYG